MFAFLILSLGRFFGLLGFEQRHETRREHRVGR